MLRDPEPLVEVDAETGVRALVALLWGISECARLLGRHPQDSAQELRVLSQQGISEEVIQLAEARGYVVCPPALTRSQDQSGMLLWRGPRVALTERGEVLAQQVMWARYGGVKGNGWWPGRAATRHKPEWDQKTGWLYYDGAAILQVSRCSSFQWLLLKAFQKARWSERVKNPLRATEGYRPERLLQTVKELNRKQKPLCMRFSVEADGQSVRWDGG